MVQPLVKVNKVVKRRARFNRHQSDRFKRVKVRGVCGKAGDAGGSERAVQQTAGAPTEQLRRLQLELWQDLQPQHAEWWGRSSSPGFFYMPEP